MKKVLSAILVCILLLSCLTVFASAAESDLPFDLVPPAYVSAKWAEGGDSPTTTNFSYSLSNDMTTFFKNMETAHSDGTIEQFMQNIGCDDIWMNVQIDWAVDDVADSVSGWHYTEYWDGDEYYGLGHDSEGNPRWSEWDIVDGSLNNATETVQDIWITRGVANDWRWNGDPETHTPGVKDQLRPEQYTYDTANEELRIDYTQHTVYFRARFVVTVRNEGAESDKFYFSEWSNITSVGKDAEKFEPLTKADIDAPVITDLHMTDKEFNGNPVVAFTLAVPEKLMENASKVTANGGGIVIETEARVKGDTEWTLMQNADWTIKSGEMECALLHLVNDSRPTIPKDTVIELRCRYRCDQPGLDDVYSDYSKIISFGTDDINQGGSQGTDATPGPNDPSNPEKKECWFCHFCPQPLGLCIFIWLLIILIVVIVIVIIVVSRKKKKAKTNNKQQ
ncbi:MAG: hypothetical protein IKQ92_11550 [Clostridia bacterium]|nr:hypothetical protein [Clostridia bacterium]